MRNKRRQSVGGAVLVMILIVMFVLIIMLMATLTVVSTAGQRIYTKYEENQAYFSARSALDVYVEKLLYDADYMAVNDSGTNWQYIYIDIDGNDKESSSGIKQGLALQLDLYNLTSLNKDAKGNTLDDYGIMENAYKGDDVFPDKTNFRDLTAGDSAKPVTSAVYQVKMPTVTDMSANHSRVSDNVDIKGEIYNDITIKVEVLDRKYDLGGDNADAFEALIAANETQFISDLGTLSSDVSPFTGSTLTYGDLKEAIKLGDRTKDQMRLRVTATANFEGVDQTSVLIFDITEPPVINGTRAITSLGTATNLNNIVIVGGVSVPDTAASGNTGSVTGNVFVKGEFTNMNGGSAYELVDGECIYIASNFKWENSFTPKGYNSDPSDKDKRPFVYVGGVASSAPGKISDDASNPVDLITHGLTFTEDGTFIYHGDIYVNGDVDFTPAGAHNAIIDGDLYVKGTVKYKNDGGVDYVPKKSDGTPTNVIKGVTFNFADQDPSTADKVEIELPSGVKKTLPTEESIYDEHYDASDNPYSAEELAYLTKEQRLAGETTSKTFASEAAAVTAANQLRIQNNALYSNASSDPIATVTDPETDPTKNLGDVYQLTAGQYTLTVDSTSCKPFLVTGGGIVDLYLPKNIDFNKKIIVDDNTTLRIFGIDPGGSYTFRDYVIANRSMYSAIESGTVYVGQSGTGLKSPTVSMYFGSGSTVNFRGGGSYATAYIQCPEATVHLENAKSVANVMYNNTNVGTKTLSVIGSVLCNDIDGSNNCGVAYVNPNVTTIPEGEPFLSFEKKQYKRN